MMQIKSIVLYNDKGEIRQLNFELNKVNIITGGHNTGKSALIPIINYCLGCSEFETPDGVIQDSVAWYAVLYQIGDTQAFVAKPKPKHGKKEHQAFYKASKTIDIPSYEELLANSSDYFIKKELSILLRQSLNLKISDYEQMQKLKTTIDYTYFYLFQPIQIMGKELFYKQHSDPKIIKESLPYFLGAKNEDELILQEEYEKKYKELSSIKQNLKRQQESINNNEEKIAKFFTQAKSLGLIKNDLLADSMNTHEIIGELKNIFNWQASINYSTVPEDFEPALREYLNKLQQEYDEKDYQLNLIKSYGKDIDSYSNEVNEHRMRLQTIGLFKNTSIFMDEKLCPLCHSEITQIVPEISFMQNALNRLNENLENAERDKINTKKQYENLEREVYLKKKEIEKIHNNLCKIAKEKKIKNDFFKKMEIQHGDIRELIGQIKEFLRSNQSTESLVSLEEKQKLLEEEIKTISQRNQLNNKLEHEMYDVNEKISNLSSKIDLSHRGIYLI